MTLYAWVPGLSSSQPVPWWRGWPLTIMSSSSSVVSWISTETVEHQWVFTQVYCWLPDRQKSVHWSWRFYFPVPTSPLRCPSRLCARSPTVHITYMDGLTNALSNSSMSLYADDLLLHRTIQSPSNYQTLYKLKSMYYQISAHKLGLNCDKCKCMLVIHKRDSTMPTVLLISGQPLKGVYSYKYLGILLTSDLSWSAHISTLCSKAWQQIGLLYCKFYRYSDVDTLKQLYMAFIRPHLEYATIVWDPHLS